MVQEALDFGSAVERASGRDIVLAQRRDEGQCLAMAMRLEGIEPPALLPLSGGSAPDWSWPTLHRRRHGAKHQSASDTSFAKSAARCCPRGSDTCHERPRLEAIVSAPRKIRYRDGVNPHAARREVRGEAVQGCVTRLDNELELNPGEVPQPSTSLGLPRSDTAKRGTAQKPPDRAGDAHIKLIGRGMVALSTAKVDLASTQSLRISIGTCDLQFDSDRPIYSIWFWRPCPSRY